MTPVAGQPRATPHGPADYGTDWSQVRQQPPDAIEATTSEVGDEVAIHDGTTAPGNATHVPVWVHRMRGDGLPTSEARSTAPRPGSQRFIKRWKDAAGGY